MQNSRLNFETIVSTLLLNIIILNYQIHIEKKNLDFVLDMRICTSSSYLVTQGFHDKENSMSIDFLIH
jgi:hypothetical protein